MTIFEKAGRSKMRFHHKGSATVEDLWDMSLKDLDAVFKGLNSQLKSQKEESLLETKSSEDDILDTKIAIVKHVVATRLNEQKEKLNEHAIAAHNQEILAAIERRQRVDLDNMSVEDLKAMLKK